MRTTTHTSKAPESVTSAAPSIPSYQIDMTKAMFWQVHRLKKDYEKWVHAPCTQSFRMFETEFVEFFSKTEWWAVPLVWLPVVAWLSVDCLTNSIGGAAPLELGPFVLFFIFGSCLWTFVEYVLHRFVFHEIVRADSPVWITFHFLMHGQHHKFPMDKGRLVFPPVPAAVLCWILLQFVQVFLGERNARATIAGLLLAYICYDLTHYYLHHGTPGPKSWFGSLKKSHMLHHFKNQTLGFGISSRLWDKVFQSGQPVVA